MKKNLLVLLSFTALLLTWCNNSTTTEIDPNTWTSGEWIWLLDVYNQEIEEAQYIKDLENFLSYNILLTTEDKPFISNTSLTANFDSQSSIQWWASFSQDKYSKAHDLEDMEITFDVKAEWSQDDLEPFYTSWSLSLVYQNNEMYANIHKFWVFMGEDDMLAKMYTLLWESLIGQWVDLEAHSGWIVTIDEKEDVRLQYILWTLKNVLNSTRVYEDSPNFLNGVAELIDTVNSRVDLWISTNGLTLITKETKYFQLSDWSIERVFTWIFHWDESEFNLALTSNKKWLQVRLYDINYFNEDIQSYAPTDVEFFFSVQENNKSNYSIRFKTSKKSQTTVNIEWILKYSNQVDFAGKFLLDNTSDFSQWQKISWNIGWKVIKKTPNGDEIFNEVSWEIIPLSTILSSL